MERLNVVEIETHLGFRTFELYVGDITAIDPMVDVLAISSYTRSYDPVPNTVIAALEENCGISVEELSHSCEFDFRDTLGCWVARIDDCLRMKRARQFGILLRLIRPILRCAYSAHTD
jgi:hypothetical protein